MDVQSFSECLTYLSGVKEDSDMATTLAGVAAGFLLSFLTEFVREKRKERKANILFRESVQRAKTTAAVTMEGAIRIVEKMCSEPGPYVYNFGLDIEPLLSLNRHVGVTDTLSSQQREAYSRALAKANLVDATVAWFRQPSETKSSSHVANAMRLIGESGSCYNSCEDILADRNRDEASVWDLIVKLGLHSNLLEELFTAKK